MSSYTNVFGNSTLPPAQYGYQLLALTASTTLYWPYNYTGTGDIAAKINSLASTGAYTITLPDASQVSPGEDILFINTSGSLITLHDAAGGTIGTVAAGAAKYLWVETNTTVAGTWGVITYGTGTSAADASALAGYGMTATAATLSQGIPSTETSSPLTVDVVTGRAQAYIFTGGSVACTFPSAVTAGSNYFFYVKNGGTGTITLTPVGGQSVDDVGTLGLNPQESCIVFSSGAAWHTVGLGRSTIYQFTKLVKDLTGLTAYTLTSSDASNKLLQFTGAPAGNVTVTVPAVVAVYYVQISTSNTDTVRLKTAAGAGVTLNQNDKGILYCDGVDVVLAQTTSVPAAQIVINNDTTTNATMYPVWVTASTGDLPEYVSSTKLSFNPSTGLLVTNVTGYAQPVAPTAFTGQTSVTVTHNLGIYPEVQVVDNTGAVLIPATIVHASANELTVTFATSTTGNIFVR